LSLPDPPAADPGKRQSVFILSGRLERLQGIHGPLRAGTTARREIMNDKHMKKPIAIAVGAALAATFGAVGVAQAQSDQGAGSPFQMTSLSSGYEATGGHGEGSCGEGKCGGDKEDKGGEGSCGEGKCGGDKEDKGGDGACGEGKCGGDKRG